MHKRRQEAHEESVLLALRALGAPLESRSDIGNALRWKRDELRRLVVEPVIVAWDGRLRREGLPQLSSSKTRLLLEEGSSVPWPPRKALPPGYHRLQIESKGADVESLILSAPTACHFPFSEKVWGVFAPVYALHSSRSKGVGDLTDLESLIDWMQGQGGKVLSTLPLLATFLDNPFEPSPYSPISRLFWNELYIDLARTPEFSSCPEAQQLLREIPPVRSSSVDYRSTMRVKRRVLEALSQQFFKHGSDQRRREFRRFLSENSAASAYARFRARWDGDSNAEQYHLYAQWMIQTQLRDLAQQSQTADCLLYLDLPLGLHAQSFDTHRYPKLFIQGMSGGAPPDPIFTTGQNWAFQPIHPQAMRADRYRYALAYIRNHLRFARLLRIDHVMGLHRLYCIPEGLTGDRGLYIRYPADEMYAILSLESHRAKAGIVGENLGMVPSSVTRAMQRHNVRQLYVAQYETVVGSGKALRNPPAGSVASLNTHDMFPFRAFIDGTDIAVRLKLGFITKKEAVRERNQRQRVRKALEKTFGKDLYAGCTTFLEKSRASIALRNLEDLWAETQPQNIPATTTEHANWRRRLRYSMERLRRLKLKTSR